MIRSPNPPSYEYFNQRMPGETPHPDDKFFKGAIGGSAVSPSGTPVWTQLLDLLSVKLNGSSTEAITARAYTLSTGSPPVTLETHIFEGVNVGPQTPALVLGFSDGVATTSGLAALFYATDGYYPIVGTFTNKGIPSSFGVGQPPTARYLRVSWSATNTFKFATSTDGVSYSKRGSTTFSKTMTPTHFFVGAQGYQGNELIVAFDYIRVTASDLIP